jgi:hypothetical protein
MIYLRSFQEGVWAPSAGETHDEESRTEATQPEINGRFTGGYARIARLMPHFCGNDMSKSVGVERSRSRRAATADAGSPDVPPRPIYSMYCLFELVLNEHEWMTDSTLDIQIGSANSENGGFSTRMPH